MIRPQFGHTASAPDGTRGQRSAHLARHALNAATTALASAGPFSRMATTSSGVSSSVLYRLGYLLGCFVDGWLQRVDLTLEAA